MPPDNEAPETQDTPAPEQPSGPSDGTPAPETPDTPESPEGTPSAPETDWEKRYTDLRPEYDRQNQRLSQLEGYFEALSDPDQQAELLRRMYGIELDEEQSDFDSEPDLEDRFERVEAYLQDQAGQAQQAQLAELEDEFIDQELGRLDPDEKWDEPYENAVVRAAFDNADEDGVPDFDAGLKEVQEFVEAQRKGWVNTKRTSQAPSGASPSQAPDLDDKTERREYMARRLVDMAAEGGSS